MLLTVRPVKLLCSDILLCRLEQSLCPRHGSLPGKYTVLLNHSLPQYLMSRPFCWLAARESWICCHAVIHDVYKSINQCISFCLLDACSDVSKDVSQFTAEGANVLIGTPGRLLDIMQQSSAMNLKRLEVFVLDEADRLLDMGFRIQLDAIMQQLPKQRRTGKCFAVLHPEKPVAACQANA
jgi:hypothetical protein